MTNNGSTEIKKIIQQIIIEEKPKTVKQLVDRTKEISSRDEEEIFQIVKLLEKEKTIQLGSPKINRLLPSSILDYFFKIHYFSIEFWVILSLIGLFFPIIILVDQGSPFMFLRVGLGLLFGLFIPGWTLSNFIFPRIYEKIDQFERVMLSIGINVGISVFSGLILNQVWIIDSMPFTIIIGSFTFVMLILSITIRILIGSNKIQFRIPKIKLFKKKRVK